MTTEELKEQTKKQIEVMQAFLDGKEIEYRNPRFSEDYFAFDKDETPSWNWSDYIYRVKTEPTYKPYDADSFLKDAIKHHFVIMSKHNSVRMLISVWLEDVWMHSGNDTGETWQQMLDNYIWADTGEPCGVSNDNNE